MIENSVLDIFTELDDSVFYDGSIDPMGLRIIWTSLGGRIFGNKLNTISTDIRFYTINLFHHHIVQKCRTDFPEKFLGITGRPPYNNEVDLFDGLIVFLECLMTHALLQRRDELRDKDIALVPGINKLFNLKGKNDPRGSSLTVNRKPGILERHALLGVHGRHKGPFREMDILSKQDYYANSPVWLEAANIFNLPPWVALSKILCDIIKTTLERRFRGEDGIKIKAEALLTEELITAYVECINPSVYQEPSLIKFWEQKLGLTDGEAGLIYKSVRCAEEKNTEIGYQELFLTVSKEQNDLASIASAIVAVEPFLTCIHKAACRLFQRGTVEIDKDIKSFLSNWINESSVNVVNINPYLTDKYFDEDALKRLKELLTIYIAARSDCDALKFALALVDFHKTLMVKRDNLPWLSANDKGSITQHRSYNFSDDEMEGLKKTTWINNYYLLTVKSLYGGLHRTL